MNKCNVSQFIINPDGKDLYPKTYKSTTQQDQLEILY